MSVKSQYFLTVIWLTVVLLMRCLADPPISETMRSELNNCTFLRDHGKWNNDLMSLCSVSKADPNNILSVNYLFISFVCMELYDVSLQLCDAKYADKLPTIEDFKRSYPLPQVDGFCSKLIFYEKRSKAAKEADVAISGLRLPSKCRSFCINKGDIHPLCEAIYFGNKILIQLNTPEQQTGELQRNPIARTFDVTPPHRDQVSIIENGSKKTASSNVENQPNERVKSDPPSVDTVQQGGGNSIPLDKKINSGDGTVVLNHDTDKKSISEIVHVDDSQGIVQHDNEPNSEQQFVSNVAVVPEKYLPSVSQYLSSVAPIPQLVPSAGTEAFYRESTDEREDINSIDTQKGRVETANEDQPSVDEGNMAQDSTSSPNSQDDTSINDGEAEEITQNLPNSKVYPGRYVHAQDSHFLAYFLTMVVICIVGYLVFHNKQKIIALALEGRRMQGSRRRPNTSSYKKLDSNLEEAVTSSCSSSSVIHVPF